MHLESVAGAAAASDVVRRRSPVVQAINLLPIRHPRTALYSYDRTQSTPRYQLHYDFIRTYRKHSLGLHAYTNLPVTACSYLQSNAAHLFPTRLGLSKKTNRRWDPRSSLHSVPAKTPSKHIFLGTGYLSSSRINSH